MVILTVAQLIAAGLPVNIVDRWITEPNTQIVCNGQAYDVGNRTDIPIRLVIQSDGVYNCSNNGKAETIRIIAGQAYRTLRPMPPINIRLL